MVKIMAVVFSPKIVLALVFRIDELSWFQKKCIGVNDQISVQDSRYYNARIQFDELLNIPAISFIFAMVNGNLVRKWENGFVNNDAIAANKIWNGCNNINIPQSNDVGFGAFNLFLYVLQIVGT
jgi:hypothetical protein